MDNRDRLRLALHGSGAILLGLAAGIPYALVVTHGNGPQVGLLALRAAVATRAAGLPGAPLDVLGAETEGMVGYLLEQELGNLLPFEVPFATILTMVEVDPHDPAFHNPTKFVGPVYDQQEADQLKGEKGWVLSALVIQFSLNKGILTFARINIKRARTLMYYSQ